MLCIIENSIVELEKESDAESKADIERLSELRNDLFVRSEAIEDVNDALFQIEKEIRQMHF